MNGLCHSPAALPLAMTRYLLYSWDTEEVSSVAENSPLLRFDHQTVQPEASRYTDYAVPAPYVLDNRSKTLYTGRDSVNS